MKREKYIVFEAVFGLAALAVGMFVWGAYRVSHTATAPPIASTGVFLVSPTQLRVLYIDYNEKYFGGKLPCYITVEYGKNPYNPTEYGHYEPETYTITINSKYGEQPSMVNLTLLHEMAHVAVRQQRKKQPLVQGITGLTIDSTGTAVPTYGWIQTYFDPHGPDFQREMKRLAAAGAFEGIW